VKVKRFRINTYKKQGGRHTNDKSRRVKIALRLPSVLLAFCLALDESFFQHLLVAEPQIGDIG
jgi:hypothetical protein